MSPRNERRLVVLPYVLIGLFLAIARDDISGMILMLVAGIMALLIRGTD